MDEDSFSFLKKIPAELSHSIYCSSCFDNTVSAPLAEYEETMEKAKDIYIFSKSQTKLTAFLKRKEEPYKVENCEDENEAILRMSFFAVQGNFNALVDIQLTSHKVIHGSHKKTMWAGTAIPITIDPAAVRDY